MGTHDAVGRGVDVLGPHCAVGAGWQVSAHTPGPWVAQGRDGLEVMGPDFKIVEVDIGEARHQADREAYEAAQADARLIAAAPDLLAALLVAVDTIKTIGRRPDPDMEDQALETIRAAIAKARGE